MSSHFFNAPFVPNKSGDGTFSRSWSTTRGNRQNIPLLVQIAKTHRLTCMMLLHTTADHFASGHLKAARGEGSSRLTCLQAFRSRSESDITSCIENILARCVSFLHRSHRAWPAAERQLPSAVASAVSRTAATTLGRPAGGRGRNGHSLSVS